MDQRLNKHGGIKNNNRKEGRVETIENQFEVGLLTTVMIY